MGEKVAVPAFSRWKGGEKFQDSIPEINRQRENRSQLNHNRVHFPEAVVQIEMQQCFDDPQMRGRADRQKFG